VGLTVCISSAKQEALDIHIWPRHSLLRIGCVIGIERFFVDIFQVDVMKFSHCKLDTVTVYKDCSRTR